MDLNCYDCLISDDVEKLMEERGIKIEDIKFAIKNAEEYDSKLFLNDEELFLTKFKNNNYTTYVEYGKNDIQYVVKNVYGHRVNIISDNK